jgi:hypothetical protein
MRNMLSGMAANSIARKLVFLVLALTLLVGGAPLAVAATGMNDCGMATAAMDMQMSMSQSQHGVPMQDHKMPCKDMGGICAATCSGAISLSRVAYSPILTAKPAAPGWPLQADFASVISRPDLPPPIAIL